jgi:8-oxo-dGTP pyrophosphatase MutT (NUDIX family)
MKTKVALIPYHDDKILVARSSNPMFGGPHFALAKGTVDPGENLQEAALREAQEELGLKVENMVLSTFKHLGNFKTFNYILSVYVCKVKDPNDFNEHDWEIAETKWMTVKEFMVIGREQHKPIVQAFFQSISS